MTAWQYAQLSVSYDNRVTPSGGKRTIAWRGPGPAAQETADLEGDVVAELNRAGTEGWELVDVATLAAGGSGDLSDEGGWSLTWYTFRRPCDQAMPDSDVSEQVERAGSKGTRTSQREHFLAQSMTPEAALVRLTARWLADTKPAGSEGPERGSASGQLFVRCEAAYPGSPADVGLIALFRAEYEDPDIRAARRDRIKAAAADYAASVVEAQFGKTWWQFSPNYPLSRAASVLSGSADWLHDLAARTLTDAAPKAAAASSLGLVGAGITANLVTAPLTKPLENAADVCELAGILIGLTTGAHLLVIACAKPLGHDLAGQVLSEAFDQMMSSADAGRTQPAASAAPQPSAPSARPSGRSVVVNEPAAQTSSVSEFAIDLVQGKPARLRATGLAAGEPMEVRGPATTRPTPSQQVSKPPGSQAPGSPGPGPKVRGL